MAVTCASFYKCGKWPTSKRLLKSLDIENEMGVEIKLINFPGIPHSENCDFLMCLANFATSIGDVFKTFKGGIPYFFSRIGIGSSEFFTEDFEAKKSLNILLF